jgi:phosphatidylglycerol:prolipoprotein diacylglycerol transferase
MLALGFLVGILWLLKREAKPKGLSTDAVLDFSLMALLGSIIGARGLFVALNWSEFAGGSLWDVLWLTRGGLSFHGGLAGAIGASLLFCTRRKIPFGTLSDAGTPSIPLGYALARVGCFLNGCCQGCPTDLPWAVRFASGSGNGGLTPPSHPAQIYDALMSLAVFGILLLLKPHFRARGQLLAAYVVLYSLERYIAEIWRAGCSATSFGPLAPLTQAQVAGVGFAVIAAAFLLAEEYRRLHAAAEPPPDEPTEPEEPDAPGQPKKSHR